jgi:hypothetical protein
MESECIIPICSVTCDKCPAYEIDSKPLHCKVMGAAIRAFQAQEDYWKSKIYREERGG